MVGFCHGGNIPLGHDNDDGDDDEDGHGTHGLQATVQKVPTENQTLKHDMGPWLDHHHYYHFPFHLESSSFSWAPEQTDFNGFMLGSTLCISQRGGFYTTTPCYIFYCTALGA